MFQNQRHGSLVNDNLTYDANGDITGITDVAEGITSRSMGYDALDRLASASAPNVWGGASFSYDPLDNLRASVVGSRNSTHIYDGNNRLSSISNGAGNTGHLYDAQGNVNQRGAQAYSFDIANRMSAATNKASYSYDGLGRRIRSVQSDGTARTFVYSQAGQLTPRLAPCARVNRFDS